MVRKRFIAGAVCPRCGEMDKMAINLDEDKRFCVACDFEEARPQDNANSSTPIVELSTRVTRPAARLKDTQAEVITLLDQKKE